MLCLHNSKGIFRKFSWLYNLYLQVKNWWVFYIHETLLVYNLEIFKNCKEVEHIMIMIIAIICIFYVGHPPLYVTFSIRLSIRCTAYLRNHTSSNHNFWYTYVKWWYLQMFISFFQNFDFLGCYVGKRAKNTPKWEQLHLSCTISQEQYIIWP